MASSDAEVLSQLYLEVVDAYKRRFMLQNRQVAVLKCFPIWKKWEKVLKHYLGLFLKLGKGKVWPARAPLKVVHWK